MYIRAGILGPKSQHADAYAWVVEYDFGYVGEFTIAKRNVPRTNVPLANSFRKWCAENCSGEHEVFLSRAGFVSEDDAILFMVAHS